MKGQVVEMHDAQQTGDEDLLDATAIQTLLHGGTVYDLVCGEMPTRELLAAVLRF